MGYKLKKHKKKCQRRSKEKKGKWMRAILQERMKLTMILNQLLNKKQIKMHIQLMPMFPLMLLM